MTRREDSESQQWPILDVTAIYAYPRTTGIQRVVRDVVGTGEGLRLVRYSPLHDSYFHVEQLPTLTLRLESRTLGVLRKALKTWLYRAWIGFGSLVAQFRLEALYNAVRKPASQIYSSYLSDTTLSSGPAAPTDEKVQLRPDDTLWLLDIPKTEAHVRFLKSLARSGRCNLGVYVYDMIPVDFPETIGGPAAEEIKQSYLDYLELVPLAAQVLFLSQHTRSRYLAFAKKVGLEPPRNERVVYPPLDFSRYDALREKTHTNDNPELSSFLSPSSGTPRILCVSPLNERKNVKVALRAVSTLLEEGVSVMFLLVAPTLSAADGETVHLVRDLTRRFPKNVLLVNQVSDEELVACYQKANIVVMPSLVEGFGLPIAEGLFFRCHVVASNMSSFVELGAIWPIPLLSPDDHGEWVSHLRVLMNKPPPIIDVKEHLPSPEQFRNIMAERQRKSD